MAGRRGAPLTRTGCNGPAISGGLRCLRDAVHDRGPAVLGRTVLQRPRRRARLVANAVVGQHLPRLSGHGRAGVLRRAPERPVRAERGARHDGAAVRDRLRAHLGGRRALAARCAVRGLHRTGPERPRRGDALDHRALVRAQARNDDGGGEGRHRGGSDGAAAADRASDGRPGMAPRGAGAGRRGGRAAAGRRPVDEAPARQPLTRQPAYPTTARPTAARPARAPAGPVPRSLPRSAAAARSGPCAPPSSCSSRPW